MAPINCPNSRAITGARAPSLAVGDGYPLAEVLGVAADAPLNWPCALGYANTTAAAGMGYGLDLVLGQRRLDLGP